MVSIILAPMGVIWIFLAPKLRLDHYQTLSCGDTKQKGLVGLALRTQEANPAWARQGSLFR